MNPDSEIRERLRQAAARLPSSGLQFDEVARRGGRRVVRAWLLKGLGAAVALVVVVSGAMVVVGGGRVNTGSAEPRTMPELSETVAATVQAKAFAEACRAVLCSGAPIYVPDDTSQAVRDAIRDNFTDEAQYVDSITMEELTGTNGLFVDGATWLDVGGVVPTEIANLVSVDVRIARGFRNSQRRTYLFEWTGNEWRLADESESPVTVTSTVS